ncbi:hypothetical protein [Prauserella muralis]|uniref:hypothetical protein n=1 Tax=Prauserella muralis TaxID=588067 RepID=UPI0011ABE411|nr:hypothetical protein [Prauserella muralis]TWE27561.1 hypothetical protein FHX69_0197 [Prauserella muralis]
MTSHSYDPYRRAITCARFERAAADRDRRTPPPTTPAARHRAARAQQARLDNATEMARALLDFDIAMRAGQALPANWLRDTHSR